jgi:hypothetical protein
MTNIKRYETLHTQDIYECASFAENILERNNANFSPDETKG